MIPINTKTIEATVPLKSTTMNTSTQLIISRIQIQPTEHNHYTQIKEIRVKPQKEEQKKRHSNTVINNECIAFVYEYLCVIINQSANYNPLNVTTNYIRVKTTIRPTPNKRPYKPHMTTAIRIYRSGDKQHLDTNTSRITLQHESHPGNSNAPQRNYKEDIIDTQQKNPYILKIHPGSAIQPSKPKGRSNPSTENIKNRINNTSDTNKNNMNDPNAVSVKATPEDLQEIVGAITFMQTEVKQQSAEIIITTNE